ncbi:hypothetical protein [Methylobacterium sp. E-046]|nr:hypothetical protein [Methylobacterium sp. E-046]
MADVRISDYSHIVCLQDRVQSRMVSAFLDVTQLLRNASAGG